MTFCLQEKEYMNIVFYYESRKQENKLIEEKTCETEIGRKKIN